MDKQNFMTLDFGSIIAWWTTVLPSSHLLCTATSVCIAPKSASEIKSLFNHGDPKIEKNYNFMFNSALQLKIKWNNFYIQRTAVTCIFNFRSSFKRILGKFSTQ